MDYLLCNQFDKISQISSKLLVPIATETKSFCASGTRILSFDEGLSLLALPTFWLQLHHCFIAALHPVSLHYAPGSQSQSWNWNSGQWNWMLLSWKEPCLTNTWSGIDLLSKRPVGPNGLYSTKLEMSAVASQLSGVWFLELPITACVLRLDDEAIRIASGNVSIV